MNIARKKAIAHIEESRAIHQAWFDWQDANDDWDEIDLTLGESAGDPEWHQSWIDKYDLVLAVLRGDTR